MALAKKPTSSMSDVGMAFICQFFVSLANRVGVCWVSIQTNGLCVARSRGLDVFLGKVDLMPDDAEGFDLALLIMTIEHLSNPLETLHEITRRLKVGGRLIIVTDNVDSPDHWLFGGRYWGGYHFPRHTYLFSSETLRTLADRLGVEVESINTALSPVNWTYSVRNCLVDWSAPKFLTNLFSLHSPIGLAMFTLLDLPLTWLIGCAILQAVFRKP